MKPVLRAAALQMCTSDDIARNADRICSAIEEARDGGADLLVTPECALSGYPPPADLDFDALVEAEARLAESASAAGLWLAFGTTRRRSERWLNSAVLLSPAGEGLAEYGKTHLFGDDTEHFHAGERLPVFPCGEWTVGLQICFDMRFPENWRILRLKGAELVLHLSNASRSAAWKVPVLEGAVRSRAAENGMFVVSANDARPPQMMVSSICGPDGRDLARAAENEETLIFAELDRSAVKDEFLRLRRTDLWNRPENRSLLLGGDE